jgi:hypothetical protein
MINENLQDFVSTVSAKGQIRYGDVRRLQRDILPNGIFLREEVELLIALNAKLLRGDKAWAQWLVAAVAAFVANGEVSEHPIKEATGEWIGRLIAASTTRFGRSIAHKLRRTLEPQHDAPSMGMERSHPETTTQCDRARPPQVRAPKAKRNKCSPRRSKLRCAVRPRALPGAATSVAAGFGWSLPGYLPAVHRSHFMNFPSAPVGLVLIPCR